MLAALLAAPLLFGAARAAESTEEMVAKAKRGVVQLYTLEYQNGRLTGNGCSGTGFAVGRAGEDSDVFVTNWHVVTCSGEFDPDQAKVYIALENATFRDAADETDRVIPCEVIYITPGNPDMAILRATEPVSGFKALPLLSSDEIMDAAHVVALGYPGVLDDFSATNGGIDDMSVTQGYVVRHAVGAEDVKSLAGTRLLIFDALISHGNSGGALVNDGGAVVGINTYGFENFSAAVCIDYAMDALDELGIQYDVYQPAPAGGLSGGAFPTTIVLAGAGIVILALAALVLALRRRPAAAPAIPDAPAAQAWADLRQKGPDSGFTLLGPGGLSRPVPASGLVIGRDPAQCTLCLPAETKGVSRRHCQVTVAGGALLLADLGSSYGTFAAGQRLEPNRPVPLPRGGSFCLGGEELTFTVR